MTEGLKKIFGLGRRRADESWVVKYLDIEPEQLRNSGYSDGRFRDAHWDLTDKVEGRLEIVMVEQRPGCDWAAEVLLVSKDYGEERVPIEEQVAFVLLAHGLRQVLDEHAQVSGEEELGDSGMLGEWKLHQKELTQAGVADLVEALVEAEFPINPAGLVYYVGVTQAEIDGSKLPPESRRIV